MFQPSPLTDEQHAAFLDLAGALSPENLHCDGEISLAEAEAKYRRLTREWRSLERMVGRVVTEDEVWAREMARFNQ